MGNVSHEKVALITGATGFVGAHLVRRLVRDGWRVHIITRKSSRIPTFPEFAEVTSHIHDGTTDGMMHIVSHVRPDVVFHLASLFLSQHDHEDVERLIQSNVLFGAQLLEAMAAQGIHCLVNTGTSWQHYNNKDFNPVCLYAATKQAFEDILEYYVQALDLKAITLQLFDTYGPDDQRQKLFYLLRQAANFQEPLSMSPGEQLIDLVYIDDVIDVYLLVAERLMSEQISEHEIYAVSSGEPISLKELVRIYGEIINIAVPVQWGAREYRPREVMIPWKKGRSVSGWKANTSLREGIRLMENANKI